MPAGLRRWKVTRLVRVLAIGALVVLFGWLGVWIGGPRGTWGSWEVEGTNFFRGRSLLDLSHSAGMYTEGLTSGESALPPSFPDGIHLLESYERRQGAVSGSAFSVAVDDRAKVFDFYRDLLLREGWHEIPADEEAKKAGPDGELLVFQGRSGTFFLGSETVGVVARFVTTRVPRGGD